MADLVLDTGALGRLLPLHAVISASGTIEQVGPTLGKIAGKDLTGQPFLKLFAVHRNGIRVDDRDDLVRVCPAKLRLSWKEKRLTFKGELVRAAHSDGYLINLSLGISLFEAVKDHHLTTSDFANTDLAIEMLYLVEANAAVMNESRNLNTRLHKARLDAEYQATTDPLTGLYNRRALDDVLGRLVLARTAFGLMHLDLDFFKEVNDTFGHAAGDAVLQQAAQILSQATRSEDSVARVGGDEFVIVFNNLVDEVQLMDIASRIVSQLERPIQVDGATCKVSCSIGITTSVFYDPPEIEVMKSDADAALYHSKKQGRARATLARTK